MFRLAVFPPVVRGEKVTVIVQEPPGLTVGQLEVWRKFPGLPVKMEIPLMDRSPEPELETVTVLLTDWRIFNEPKSSWVALRAITGLPMAPD